MLFLRPIQLGNLNFVIHMLFFWHVFVEFNVTEPSE